MNIPNPVVENKFVDDDALPVQQPGFAEIGFEVIFSNESNLTHFT